MYIYFSEISEDDPEWEDDINLPDEQSSDTPASRDDLETSYPSGEVGTPPNSTPQKN